MNEQPRKSIFVTRPFLPPLEELLPYFEQIWHTRQLTNGGELHRQFEAALAQYLGVRHISLFANGTLALLTALKALHVTGEVITTPYSFIATAHSLLWNGLTPVFCDIDPVTMCLDPEQIEAAITPRTTAIMPVHVYGYPCDVARLKTLAERHRLKVIYDAAHAFGVRDAGGSILRHGDLSVLSFHATKIFTTFEGGAIISPNAQTKKKIDNLKNFGFSNEITVTELGINGKMNEIQAAVGLAQLKHIDGVLRRRCAIDQAYRKQLAGIDGISCPTPPEGTIHNHAYFPILVGDEYGLTRDQLHEVLRDHGIFVRRYFYPLISDFKMYRPPGKRIVRFPVAHGIASRVICLPIYPEMEAELPTFIASIIARHR